MQTKQLIKITAFVMVMSAIVIFSFDIQNHIIESYNHYINQLASHTVANMDSIGF